MSGKNKVKQDNMSQLKNDLPVSTQYILVKNNNNDTSNETNGGWSLKLENTMWNASSCMAGKCCTFGKSFQPL